MSGTPGFGLLPLTVNEYCAVWVRPPAAVTVIVYVPAVAFAAAATVIVELPPEVTEAGLNETETPAGAPAADRVTVCALPVVVAVLTVEVAEAPWLTEPEVGLNDTEKSLVGVPVQV